jgi:L-cystine transport system substrate-binding protein
VDGAVKQLKESGKLAQISKDVIGGDYTESE